MDTTETSAIDLTLAAKIYKIKAIQVATFLGGPLVAGYLIAENYKAFNEPDKIKMTWICTVIATILIFTGVFLIPANSKFPNIVIPLIYSWITYYIVQHYQGEQISAHLNSGGQTYNWWRVIAIGLIGTVITVILVFLAAFFIVP